MKRKRKRNEVPCIYSSSEPGWSAFVSYHLLDIFDFYCIVSFLISFGALVYLVHVYTFFDRFFKHNFLMEYLSFFYDV